MFKIVLYLFSGQLGVVEFNTYSTMSECWEVAKYINNQKFEREVEAECIQFIRR